MGAPAAGIRKRTAPPSDYTELAGALEFEEDATQGDNIWRIQPIGGSASYRYSLVEGAGMYQLSAASGPDVWLQRGPSGTPAAGNPEPFLLRVTDRWNRMLDISESCNVLDDGDVAPVLAAGGPFDINDDFTNGQFVFTATLANTPAPAATRSIQSQSVSGLFAINSSTGDVTVANAGALVAGTSPTVTVLATNGVSPDDTETYTVNIADASEDAFVAQGEIVNDSGVTQPANSFASEVGHYFKENDIPAGTTVEVRAADGTTKLDRTVIRHRTFYPNGSLKFAGFIPKLKTQLLTGASQVIKFYKTSTPHGTSGFSVAAAFAGTDFKIEGELIAGYTAGTYTASFNDAIAGVEGVNYWIDDDSEGGPLVTGVASFKLGGVPHAQLRCKFFMQVLKDTGSGIFGWLVEPATQNGYHGVSSPQTTTAIFKSLILKNGSTTLMTKKAPGTPPAFTRHANQAVQSFAIAAGGTGYILNGTVTLVGGNGVAAQFQIFGVSGGIITQLGLKNGLYGDYSVVPSNPVSVSGGGGSGATVNITWGRPFLSFSALGDIDSPEGGDRIPVQLATTGTLPGALALNTGYFFSKRAGSTTIGMLYSAGENMNQDKSPVFMSSDGSGTHTLVPAMAIEWYEAGKAFRSSEGRPVFVPGTGSVEPKCWFEFDNYYRVATKQFGPRDLSVNPSGLQDKTFEVFSQGGGPTVDDFTWFEDQTGERMDIGHKTGWDWKAFHNNNWTAWKRVLRNALVYGSSKLTAYERNSTHMFVNNTGQSYSGLGTGLPGIRVRPTGPYYDGGATGPASGQGRIMSGGGPFPSAHATFTNIFAYEMTGNPLLLHYALASAHRLMLTEGIGPETIGATPVGTSVWKNVDGQMRSMGWNLNGIAGAARICPASYRNTQFKAMLLDILASSAQYVPLKNASLLNSFMLTNKFWWTANQGASWQIAYTMMAVMQAYEETRNAGFKTMMEDMLAFLDNIRVNKGAGAGTYLSWYNMSHPSWLTIDAWSDITVALSHVNGAKAYIAMVRAGLMWAKAYGFTIPAGMEAAINSTFIPDTWFDTVYALTGTFNQTP